MSAYPKVVELNNQLKQLRKEITAEEMRMQQRIRDEYLAALQRENLLTTAFEQQKQQANQLNESAIEYSALKRDAETNRQLYQDLLQRLKEAGVSAGLRSSNIRVVDVARTPTHPIKPNVPRNLELGLLLGLACGIGLAFVLESLDTSIRNTEELSAISALPALGIIPLQLSSNGHLRKRLKTVSAETEKSESPTLITYARPTVRSSGGIPSASDIDSSLLVWRTAESDSRHQRNAARRKDHSQRKFSSGISAARKPCFARRCGPSSPC